MVVLQALLRFGRTALRTRTAWALGIACAAASALGAHELAVLGAAGLAAAAMRRAERGGALAGLVPFSAALGAITAATSASGSLDRIFLVFLKIGSVLFGSGYVLLAFLRSDVVVRYGWLTEGQLLDAIAVGQVTPGPVFSAATFVGYLVAGVPGAAAATVGIFLPAFVFVAASGPIVARIRRSPAAGALLDGVNVASLALMAVVTAQLARGAVRDVPSAVLALSAFLLLRHGLNASWVVLGGAVAGGLLALAA
jgi:chromate transporter